MTAAIINMDRRMKMLTDLWASTSFVGIWRLWIIITLGSIMSLSPWKYDQNSLKLLRPSWTRETLFLFGSWNLPVVSCCGQSNRALQHLPRGFISAKD